MIKSENKKVNKSTYLENVKERRVKENKMIFGIRAVLEAIEAGKEFDRILIRRDMNSPIGRELLEATRGKNFPIVRVPQEKLNRLTEKNHQGVIAFLSEISYQNIEEIVFRVYEEGRVPFFVVLDGITDVRNFGAIARTCECAAVDAIILPMRGSVSINADAIKTSAGALHQIPVCRVDDLTATLKFLADSGIQLVAATEKSQKNYVDCDFTTPLAVVMGAEDIGISEENLKCCNHQVRIPMFGKIASLNVSVSAGILLYEVVRQRQ
jgi:23S rRNA (guanosine2251-2'-O)-methyltransferase